MKTANRVKETTSTIGTGNFTTTGAVTGSGKFFTFASKYELNERFSYFAINDADNEFEEIVGYLSASTTLVREKTLDNSLGTKVSISFTTAPTLLVSLGESSDRKLPHSIPPDLGTRGEQLLSSHIVGYSSSIAPGSTVLHLTTFVNEFSGHLNRWKIYVKTAVAGAVIRLGIYIVDPNTGLATGSPWMESDDIDCGSTGWVSLSFANNVAGPITPQLLPKAFFLGIAAEDAGIRLQGEDYSRRAKTWLAKDLNGSEVNLRQAFTMGTPTPGSAILPTIGTITYQASGAAVAGFAT